MWEWECKGEQAKRSQDGRQSDVRLFSRDTVFVLVASLTYACAYTHEAKRCRPSTTVGHVVNHPVAEQLK